MESKEDLKKRILEKASESFFNRGYSGVKTDELAAELGISKRTLYELFPSKNDLLMASLQGVIRKIENETSEIVEEITNSTMGFIEGIKKLMDAISESIQRFGKDLLEDLKKKAPEAWLEIERFRADAIKKNFKILHRIGVERGYVKKEINEEVFYLIYHYSITNILRSDIVARLPMTMKDVIEDIIDVLFTGSFTDKGREDFDKRIKKELD